ncbi:MAG: pilus (MSHA type) biogenesis protein MshL [Magnetococcales bacterium]|nr:pilus (MSHA type) biogenesis protein MshL [Magnetococcales bacterium]NGZ25426.1 pilus (MSHA type) biogenesis protein MshL [Magnetococcales bacterium]
MIKPLFGKSMVWRVALSLILLTSCAQIEQKKGLEPSRNHLLRATNPPASEDNKATLDTTDPNAGSGHDGEFQEGGEVFTVTVTDTPVKDILFALAKDANMNIDIYPGIQGRITLSAINQTMPQILDRIAKQVNLRYEIKDGTIVIAPDRAYLKVYQIDYINMTRKSTSNIKVSSNLSTNEKEEENPLLNKGERNQSESVLSNTSTNQFWETMIRNINAIIGKDGTTPPQQAASSTNPGGKMDMGADPFGPVIAETPSSNSSPAAIIAANPEAGLLSVMATSQQHQLIQQFLDKVMANVHRQVLIESTVVEVELSDRAQEGVDWNEVYDLRNKIGGDSGGQMVTSALAMLPERAVGNLPFFNLNLLARGKGADPRWAVDATLKMLQRFGNVKVLSSPKIMALNNQPAILKVVENKIFFTLAATSAAVTSNANGVISTTPLINTKVHTVPIGLVMTVTPQISDKDIVTLNVRPTISNISGWVNDPSPHLPTNATNRIPEIRVREMETMLRIHTGQVAVLGGLMQDKVNKNESSVPGVGDVPLLGKLFSFKDDEITKTELVVFLRPVVMTQGEPKVASKPAGGPRAANNVPNAVAGGLDFTQFNQGTVPNPNAGVMAAPPVMNPTVQTSAAPPPPAQPMMPQQQPIMPQQAMPAQPAYPQQSAMPMQQAPAAPMRQVANGQMAPGQPMPMGQPGSMPMNQPMANMNPPTAPASQPPPLDGKDVATLRTSTEMDFTRPMKASEEAKPVASKAAPRNPTISAYTDGPAADMAGDGSVSLSTSRKQ